MDLEYAKKAGLPLRHLMKIADGAKLTPNAESCKAQILPMLNQRNTVLIRGGHGNGKTHLATQIGYDWIGTKRGAVKYQTVCGLLLEIKDAFGDRTKGDTPLTKAKKCGLLILDELLANTGSAFDQATIRELIDSRYRDMKATIVLTNLDDKGLQQAIDQPTIDRMFDGGCIYELAGESLRA